MHLIPREMDKLLLHGVGFLAQKRLARGLRLNHPEAVGLIAAQLLELIRDGKKRRRADGPRAPPAGARGGHGRRAGNDRRGAAFADGTKLVTVHHPVALEHGDLALALHGSFLPVPDRARFAGAGEAPVPGEVIAAPGEITLNEGRESVAIAVTNLGDRPIQVGSHYHFFETNRALSFDRGRAYGMRLDIPAGNAVRFEPGERKTVQLVALAGDKVAHGGNAIADGPIDSARKSRAVAAAVSRGFAHAEEKP